MAILTIIVGFVLAFQSGQFSTLIEIEKQDGRKPHWKLYFFMILCGLISLYNIIALYGMR